MTVPVSSTVRESMRGARPRRANSVRNTRLGRTTATYWSPATTLSPALVAATDVIAPASVWARSMIGAIRRLRKPASSMMAAKLSAPRMSQTVVSMLDMPPLENRSSIVAFPLADSKPLASAW